ncbi:MAG: hypothetical protein RUMPE_01225 [Eubacteriales bacterium SKADARSKE-1]|nr:hypothetical protein [Eubacteriales bacterium SKADARSKE-1]
MKYKDLSEEYLAQYKNLSLYIRSLKMQLQKTELQHDRELYRRVTLLYSICLDLKHVGEYLKKCERREKT